MMKGLLLFSAHLLLFQSCNYLLKSEIAICLQIKQMTGTPNMTCLPVESASYGAYWGFCRFWLPNSSLSPRPAFWTDPAYPPKLEFDLDTVSECLDKGLSVAPSVLGADHIVRLQIVEDNRRVCSAVGFVVYKSIELNRPQHDNFCK